MVLIKPVFEGLKGLHKLYLPEVYFLLPPPLPTHDSPSVSGPCEVPPVRSRLAVSLSYPGLQGPEFLKDHDHVMQDGVLFYGLFLSGFTVVEPFRAV